MKGRVKIIKRSEWYVGNHAYQHSHDIHDNRLTCFYAETWEGHQILIDESDVRSSGIYRREACVRDAEIKLGDRLTS